MFKYMVTLSSSYLSFSFLNLQEADAVGKKLLSRN